MKFKNKAKVEKYLRNRGLMYLGKVDWSATELEKFITDNKSILNFEGEESGSLKFCKTKTGKRFIQFIPQRCFID